MLTRRGRDAEDRAASKFRRRASFLRGFPSQTSRAPYYDFEFFRGKFPQSDSRRPVSLFVSSFLAPFPSKSLIS